jgi:nucleoside-diphosphate-sugar epimerase
VEGRPVRLFGDGTQRRDFTHVDDIARGTIAALRKVGCEAFNLGSDEPIPLMDALHWIEEFAGRAANIERHPRHSADVPATWASIDKAARMLDWRPQVETREGFRRVVEWYRENRDWAADIDTA